MPTNLAIPGRWLRHVKDGTVYGYTASLASNPLVEEVTEEEAFPERFLTEKQKTRKSELNLSTDPKKVAKAKPTKKTKDALAADASRGMGKKK
jgi:hypothetical protein